MACSALEKGIYVKWILGFYSLICSPLTIYSSMLNKKNPRFLVSAQVEAGCVFEKVCVRGSAQHAGQWSIWFL